MIFLSPNMLFCKLGSKLFIPLTPRLGCLFDFILTDETLRAQVFLFSTLCDIPLELPDLAAGAMDLIFYSPTFFHLKQHFPGWRDTRASFCFQSCFYFRPALVSAARLKCVLLSYLPFLWVQNERPKCRPSPWHLSQSIFFFPQVFLTFASYSAPRWKRSFCVFISLVLKQKKLYNIFILLIIDTGMEWQKGGSTFFLFFFARGEHEGVYFVFFLTIYTTHHIRAI